MRKYLFLLITALVLAACGNANVDIKVENNEIEEMTDTTVKLYLHKLTSKYSIAYTPLLEKDKKLEYLNEAITDINLVVLDIEDDYETDIHPADKLLKLADVLLDGIDAEILEDEELAYNKSVKAGEIIGDLSREYTDGELPTGIQTLTGKKYADD